MKVRCVRIFDPRGNELEQSPWLTIGKDYVVLSVIFDIGGAARLRLVGDRRNGLALFRWDAFEIVSPIIPPTWIIFPGPQSYIYLTPEPWTEPGFWERYYDQDQDAMMIFERERKKIIDAELEGWLDRSGQSRSQASRGFVVPNHFGSGGIHQLSRSTCSGAGRPGRDVLLILPALSATLQGRSHRNPPDRARPVLAVCVS